MSCIYIVFETNHSTLKNLHKKISLSLSLSLSLFLSLFFENKKHIKHILTTKFTQLSKPTLFPQIRGFQKTDIKKKAPHDFTRTSKRWSARLHSATFTQALMAALQLLSAIDCRRSRASFNLGLKFSRTRCVV